MPRIDGVDVSTWQGVIDYPALPALRFVAAQVGWRNRSGERDRGEMVLDDRYKRNVAEARKTPGRWLFHYCVPTFGPPWQEQLDRFLDAIGPLPVGEGIMWDLEYEHTSRLGWPAVKAMLDECERRIGRPVLHYGELFHAIDKGRPKWVAHYGKTPGSEVERAVMLQRYAGVDSLAVWQWSGKGRVTGITGDVDLNEILDERLLGACVGMPTMNERATPKLLSTWDTKNGVKRRTIRPRVIILHTNAAGSAVSLQSNWNHAVNGGTQAHFQVQGGFHPDGTVGAYQFLPTDREGVGSWNADPFAITIETQDNGATPIEKLRTTPWTPAQVEAIAQVCAVECRRWGIPARIADRWDGSGIGWHRQWGINTVNAPSKGWGVPVGTQRGYVNPWTMAAGKTCPEDARIAQVPAVVARVQQILAGTGEGDGSTEVDDVDVINPTGTAAKFLRGAVLVWITSGAQEQRLVAEHGPVKQVTLASLKDYALVGALPTGDSRAWTAADFAFVVPTVGPKGDKGDPGDPGEPGEPGPPGSSSVPVGTELSGVFIVGP